MWVISAFVNGWPVFAAIALVCVITYGAMTPYIRQERRRRAEQEQMDD